METTVKVAVSLPKEEFRLVERRRRQLKLSRSAAVARAIAQWLHASEEDQRVRQYMEGYRRSPESTKGWKALERVQAEGVAREFGHETW